MSNPVSFLTGATGLVGSELLRSLLNSNPNRHLIVLARNPDKISLLGANGRVNVVEGDLTKPRLGLSSSARRQIKNEVTEVIHSGAQTRFGLTIEEARATNTYGTTNLLN